VAEPKDLDIRGWVEAVARDLVDQPESVEVRLIDEGETDLLEVVVEPSEIGRVIGRQGRTVQALRTLLGVAGARHGRNYELEILD
jgi:predicted RNA-binding protein YlqC (UPF0109 family)